MQNNGENDMHPVHVSRHSPVAEYTLKAARRNVESEVYI